HRLQLLVVHKGKDGDVFQERCPFQNTGDGLRQQVGKEPKCPWHTGWELAKQRISAVEIEALAVIGYHQSARLGRFSRIVTGEQRSVARVPGAEEEVPPVFHPAGKVLIADDVGQLEEGMVGL